MNFLVDFWVDFLADLCDDFLVDFLIDFWCFFGRAEGLFAGGPGGAAAPPGKMLKKGKKDAQSLAGPNSF